MSSDILPLDLDSLPVVMRTDMRDVRLVSVVAHVQDVIPADTDIAIRLEPSRYRVDGASLFVRTVAGARYFRHEATETDNDAGRSPEPDAAPEGPPAELQDMGSIEVEVLAELDFQGGEVTQEQMDEFLDQNFLFMIFPYVRTLLQQTAADLRLPPTVIPFLRRGSLTPTQATENTSE